MSKQQVVRIGEVDNKQYGFNPRNLLDPEVEVLSPEELVEQENKEKRKRGPGRPPKNPDNAPNTYTDIEYASNTKKKKAEDDLEDGYKATTGLLYGAISQADSIYSQVQTELDRFYNSPGYGGRTRSEALSSFVGTQATIISTKVAAIRELDNIRHKINDMKLKRQQLMKDMGDENSDKYIMDAYSAFINAPKYGLPSIGPVINSTSLNTGINLSNQNIPIGGAIDYADNSSQPSMVPTQAPIDYSYEEYKRNLTPVQRRMVVGSDPDIKEVVVYNQSTGSKRFDVINVRTGQSIPGVERRAEFLLDSMRIDLRNGIAVNSNINESFPLVLEGSRAMDEL